jgi:hypothetical protein
MLVRLAAIRRSDRLVDRRHAVDHHAKRPQGELARRDPHQILIGPKIQDAPRSGLSLSNRQPKSSPFVANRPYLRFREEIQRSIAELDAGRGTEINSNGELSASFDEIEQEVRRFHLCFIRPYFILPTIPPPLRGRRRLGRADRRPEPLQKCRCRSARRDCRRCASCSAR